MKERTYKKRKKKRERKKKNERKKKSEQLTITGYKCWWVMLMVRQTFSFRSSILNDAGVSTSNVHALCF